MLSLCPPRGVLALFLQDAQALEVKNANASFCSANTRGMRYHGWLETYAQLAMPDRKLTFRNHGFCGDKIDN